MTKKQYLFYGVLTIVIGLVIIPGVLNWIGLPYSFADILYTVLGEPTTTKKIIAGLSQGFYYL